MNQLTWLKWRMILLPFPVDSRGIVIVRERVVSLEAQTRTNEAQITALLQTLKDINVY